MLHDFEDLIKSPAFVINLERRQDRWNHTKEALRQAGFRDVQRFRGVDGQNAEELQSAWSDTFGADAVINMSYDAEFADYKGKQGVLLSQVRLWKYIVDNQIPVASIFEDDVIFHSQWADLAPTYLGKTPPDWDILFMGSQIEFASRAHIDRGPVFCLHAYCVTLEGARKLYDFVMNARTATGGGIYTIDTMLKVHMHHPRPCFNWYVWNGTFFPDPKREMAGGWTKRNHGLVFQDVQFGSDVRQYEV